MLDGWNFDLDIKIGETAPQFQETCVIFSTTKGYHLVVAYYIFEVYADRADKGSGTDACR
jgi:hypothetical protein